MFSHSSSCVKIPIFTVSLPVYGDENRRRNSVPGSLNVTPPRTSDTVSVTTVVFGAVRVVRTVSRKANWVSLADETLYEVRTSPEGDRFYLFHLIFILLPQFGSQ